MELCKLKSPGDFVKTQTVIQTAWDGAWDAAYLTSS